MTAHKHCRETLGGDDCGYCCGQLVVTSRVCRYCWARFKPERSAQTYCSKPCSARAAAWNSWMTATAYCRKGPKMPPAGASLAQSVLRFETSREVAA